MVAGEEGDGGDGDCAVELSDFVVRGVREGGVLYREWMVAAGGVFLRLGCWFGLVWSWMDGLMDG